MAVYYKFKSAKEFDSIPMDGAFISVGTLKEKIFESKHLSRGTDFDLVVTNAQTNEEFLDDAQIPKNTSVLIRRVPGRPRMPIVAAQEQKTETKIDHTEPESISMPNADASSAMKCLEDSEWEEFGSDLYSIPEALPVQSHSLAPDIPPTNKADEDSKIKALIETPALDWQRQGGDGLVPGRGFGRGMGGRGGGRGFGRLGLERKTPPQGYVCHRCKVPGHFIQHCPTNGDPNYDIKRAKPPTGIPRSMLQATPDGSYALPSGASAVLKPNEDAFEKEVGLPSTRSLGDLPPELHCPLCKEVMKDAVLTSKCCFKSFCDKCIRDYIILRLMCVCGARNILADDLLPNKTLRDTISRILESGNSSAENAGSTFQVQDMESARCPQPKIPSPTASAASKGEQKSLPAKEESENMMERTAEVKTTIPSQQNSERLKAVKVADASEATLESASIKEPASQGSALPAEEEVQQKVTSGEAGKKKKKKKVRGPANDFQWKAPHDLAADYMMPLGTSSYNPYWPGVQPGFDAFMGPYAPGMPYMSYPMGMDMPYPRVIPPDPFGPQNYMFPALPPQRDLADFGMGMNMAPPMRSREEFEARKAELRRNREREFSKDRELGKDASSVAEIPAKPRSRPMPQTSGGDHRHEHQRSRSERASQERSSRDIEPPPRTSKRKSSHHHDCEHGRDNEYDDYEHGRDYERDRDHHQHRPESPKLTSETGSRSASASLTAADKKQKGSVFSRISYPEEEPSKKRSKHSSEAPTTSSGHHKSSLIPNGYHDEYKKAVSAPPSSGKKGSSSAADKKGSSSAADYESSDEDRHFKRRPSRYEASPPAAEREEPRQSRSSKERERSSGSSSRHR